MKVVSPAIVRPRKIPKQIGRWKRQKLCVRASAVAKDNILDNPNLVGEGIDARIQRSQRRWQLRDSNTDTVIPHHLIVIYRNAVRSDD